MHTYIQASAPFPWQKDFGFLALHAKMWCHNTIDLLRKASKDRQTKGNEKVESHYSYSVNRIMFDNGRSQDR